MEENLVKVTRERAEIEKNRLFELIGGLGELILAGSYRRGNDEMKDLDFILISDTTTMSQVLKLLPKHVYFPVFHGEQKAFLYSFREHQAIKIDLVIVPSLSRAAALVHFTGPKEFNIKLRVIARKKNMKLNDKYVLSLETGEVFYPKTEEELFSILGVEFEPPEMRH